MKDSTILFMKKYLQHIRSSIANALIAYCRMSFVKKLRWIVIVAIFTGAIPGSFAASEMRWVLIPEGTNGTCVSNTDCNQNIFCYGLEYTPDTTGQLTSYTTGFIVECVINDSPILSNESCVMPDNSILTNWCIEYDLIQFHCQGNSGMFDVTENVPVIIHQVCFSVPPGTTLNVLEDGVTDLTTSIDISPGNYVTEYPEYENLMISGLTPDVVTNTNDDGCGSLRAQIANAASGSTITFNSSLMNQTITLTSGEIDINKNLTIQGPGMLNLNISGNNTSRIFHLFPGNDFTIEGLTLKDATAVLNGGAIFAEGILTLQNILLQNNFQDGSPKAISVTGTATVTVGGTVEMKN